MNIERHWTIIFLLLNSCSCRENKISFKVIHSPSGYGYAIFKEGKKIIDQPHLPAMTTAAGFSDSIKAAKTAVFIIGKIEKDQWPPTVSKRELDSLGVID